MARRVSKKKRKTAKKRAAKVPSLLAFIKAQEPATLRIWLLSAAKEIPDLATWIRDRQAIERGDGPALLARISECIDTLDPEPQLGEGFGRHAYVVQGADWGGLNRALRAALGAGLYDEVLATVPEILGAAVERVQYDHDDFENAREAGRVLETALSALAHGSLSAAEQILYLYAQGRRDDYDILPDFDPLLKSCTKADWSEAATLFAKRLPPRASDASSWRTRLDLSVLEGMLARAGRGSEGEGVWLREAETGGSAVPLIERYLKKKRFEEAERWCLKALDGAEGSEASSLHRLLGQSAEGRRDWPLLAALRAERFRKAPSRRGYAELCEAARKAGAVRKVRAGVRAFLDRQEGDVTQGTARWGLPPVPEAARLAACKTVSPSVPLEIALEDGKPKEVLSCFDALCQERPSAIAVANQALAVAQTISKAYPARALEIYMGRVDSHIARAKPAEYSVAVDLLRAMRPLDRKVGPAGAFKRRIDDLRERHHRKWRLVELLDGLSGRPAATVGGGRQQRGRRAGGRVGRR